MRDGVIASRIAAHAADIVKVGPKARRWDDLFSQYRYQRNWKEQIALALDPVRAQQLHDEKKAASEDTCTMCGEYCSYRMSDQLFRRLESDAPHTCAQHPPEKA